MMTNIEATEAHAANALAMFFTRRLIAPRVLFQAPTVDGLRSDLIVVDRDGAGDIHSIEIKISDRDFGNRQRAMTRLEDSGIAHFYWLAVTTPLNKAEVDDQTPSKCGVIGMLKGHNGEYEVRVIRPASRTVPSRRSVVIDALRTSAKSEELESSESSEEVVNEPAAIDELLQRANEARELSVQGHSQAALLLGWSAFEGILRVANSAASGEMSGKSFIPLRAILARIDALGLFDPATLDAIRDANEARNVIVHGLQSPPNDTLNAQVETLANVSQLIAKNMAA